MLKKLLIVGVLALVGTFPAGASAKVMFGLSTESPTEFREVQAQMPVSLYSPFVGWKGANEFPIILEQARSFHARPMISWETWDARTRVPGSTRPHSTPGMSVSSIAKGKFDAYIKRQAVATKRYQKVVYLRFDHEMNGSWYPWGTNSKSYVKMWKHVWGVFHRMKVKNVRWIWSPNLNTFEGDAIFDARVKAFYPGNKYVDIIGATITRVQTQGGTLIQNDPNNGYYQGPAWFFQRFDRIKANFPGKPMWITEALVDREEMEVWMPAFRAEIDARPWVKAVNWLSTNGPQTPTFGNMNWHLSDEPFARQFLVFN